MQYRFKVFKICFQFIVALLLVYVLFVLGYVWWHCYKSPLEGGANGKLDAYRHTFASAVVAYTASPKLVRFVSAAMERKKRPANMMDRHNNAIGAKIGAEAKSLGEIDAKVVAQVASGQVDAKDAAQTTWMPPRFWGPGFLW